MDLIEDMPHVVVLDGGKKVIEERLSKKTKLNIEEYYKATHQPVLKSDDGHEESLQEVEDLLNSDL